MRLAIGVVAMLLVEGVAFAQYNVPAQASGESRRLDIADDGKEVIVVASPDTSLGYELGASLDFLTSDPVLGPKDLRFTDVVLFRLHGLIAIGNATEVFAGADLLPKQPSYSDELIWQGALLGVHHSFGKTFAAYARGQGGPLLDRQGYWFMGESAVQIRRDLTERVLFWESSVGGVYTHLLFDDDVAGKPFWQVELLTQTGLAIRERHGRFATWLNFGFHFPLVHHPDALDPQVRVGVYLGMLGGITRTLDLFTEVSILDRGDLGDPSTTLPILAGGFDQKRILFGFNRRFGGRKH